MLLKLSTFLITFVIVSFLDYYMTLLGVWLARKELSKHHVAKDYELNPVFKKDISRLRLFNPKHLLILAGLVFLFTIIYYMNAIVGNFKEIELMQGIVFSVYAIILIRHIKNIISISMLNKFPNLVKGSIKVTVNYMLASSLIDGFGTTLIFVFVWFFNRNIFTLSFVIGGFLFMLAHLFWWLVGRMKK